MLKTEDITPELLQNTFLGLPDAIQQSVVASNWEEEVRKIWKKYSLHVDVGAAIETQVSLTILGLESREMFVDVVSELVQDFDVDVEELVKEVNDNIFLKIKDNLVETTENRNVDLEKSEETPENILKEIEEHDEKAVFGSSREPIYTPFKKPSKKPETKSLDSTVEEIAEGKVKDSGKTEEAPTNLPTGDIKDVPRHGHNHRKDTSRQKETAKPEEDDIIGGKLSESVSSPKETVKKQDPYRESIE